MGKPRGSREGPRAVPDSAWAGERGQQGRPLRGVTPEKRIAVHSGKEEGNRAPGRGRGLKKV